MPYRPRYLPAPVTDPCARLPHTKRDGRWRRCGRSCSPRSSGRFFAARTRARTKSALRAGGARDARASALELTPHANGKPLRRRELSPLFSLLAGRVRSRGRSDRVTPFTARLVGALFAALCVPRDRAAGATMVREPAVRATAVAIFGANFLVASNASLAGLDLAAHLHGAVVRGARRNVAPHGQRGGGRRVRPLLGGGDPDQGPMRASCCRR